MWFTEQDVVLLMLANREDVNPNLLLGRLAGALFGEPAWPEGEPAELASRSGIFVDPERGRVLEVGQHAGLLHADSAPFVPQGATGFMSTDPFNPRQLVFSPDFGSVVSHDVDGAIEYRRGRVTPLSGDAALWCTGVFTAPGLPAEVELRVEADGGLRLATGPRGVLRQQWHLGELTPDLLVLGDAPGKYLMVSVQLRRGADGQVASIVINGYRLYDLVLHRQRT
jgi:hypothetical protein